MKLEYSISAQCDSCGRWKNLTEGKVYPQLRYLAGRPVVKDVVLDMRQRSLADLVSVFVVAGSIVTTTRNIDGEFATYEDPADLPNRIHRDRHFLVCRDCKGAWVPPFSSAATRDLERIRLANSTGVDELESLRAENERLRLAMAEIRTASEAVAS